jgi:hypothetical protein
MGILILGIAGIYLLISSVIVLSAIRHARRNGLSAKRWGWGTAFVMWLIPFWDWLPTVAVHQYYCATESGFWVYKTLDQWEAENPGIMEKLVTNNVWPHKEMDGNDVASISQRINLVYVHQNKQFLHRWPDIRELVDSKSSEILARYVNFSTSYEKRQAGWSGWKFWLENDYCPRGKNRLIQFGNYYMQFTGAKNEHD